MPVMSAMTLPQRSQYVTSSEEWESQRDVIVELYISQSKTLRQIMQVMQENYQFLATARQYKFHLAKWGVRKNRRHNEDMHEEKASKSRPSSKLRRIGSDQKNSPPNNSTALKQTKSSHAIPSSADRIQTRIMSSSNLFAPAAPDMINIPDQCMRVCRLYVAGAFSTGLWEPHPDWSQCVVQDEKLLMWNNLFGAGIDYLQRADTTRAFKCFQKAFRQFSPLLKKPDPRLFIYMYLVAVYLADLAPELSRSIYKYAADLTLIQFRSQHPLYLYLSFIANMTPEDLRRNGRSLGECLINLLKSGLDPRSEMVAQMMALKIQLNCFLASRKIIDFKTSVVYSNVAFRELEALPQNSSFHAMRGKLYLINMCEELDRFPEAHELIAEVLASDEIHKHPRSLKYLNLATVLIAKKEGDPQVMLQVADRFLEVSLSILREDPTKSENQSVVIMLGGMESFLQEIGHVDEAEKIRTAVDQTLLEISKGDEEVAGVDLGTLGVGY